MSAELDYVGMTDTPGHPRKYDEDQHILQPVADIALAGPSETGTEVANPSSFSAEKKTLSRDTNRKPHFMRCGLKIDRIDYSHGRSVRIQIQP